MKCKFCKNEIDWEGACQLCTMLFERGRKVGEQKERKRIADELRGRFKPPFNEPTKDSEMTVKVLGIYGIIDEVCNQNSEKQE